MQSILVGNFKPVAKNSIRNINSLPNQNHYLAKYAIFILIKINHGCELIF